MELVNSRLPSFFCKEVGVKYRNLGSHFYFPLGVVSVERIKECKFKGEWIACRKGKKMTFGYFGIYVWMEETHS